MDKAEYFIKKWVMECDNEDRHVDTCRNMIAKMSNPEFLHFVSHICEWEERYENEKFKKGFEKTSNLFQILFKAVGSESNARPTKDEDFLYSKYIYKGLTFKTYIGQGSFYRISMRKRLIFQSR